MSNGDSGPNAVQYSIATSEALPQMVDLCRSCYGPRAESEDWWRWRFFSSAPAKSFVALASHGEILVGMQPVRLEGFQTRDVRLLGAALEGAMVRPGWQGRGIFARLLSATLGAAWERTAAFAYSMPNEKSYPVFMQSGWWDLGERAVLVSLVLPSFGGLRERPGSGSVKASAVLRFGSGMEDLSRPGVDLGDMTPVHDRAWWEWRYCSNPALQYILVEARGAEGDLQGMAVGRVLRIGPLPVGVLMQSAGEGPGLLAAIEELRAQLRRHGAFVSVAVVSASAQVRALSRCGYRRLPGFLVPKRFRTVCLPRPSGLPQPPAAGTSWHLSLGDWDGV